MLKKAGPFKYKKMKALPSDSDISNTRFYIFTDQGNYWCPPFQELWQTFPEQMEQCLEINNVYCVRLDLGIAAKCHLDRPVDLDIGETVAFKFDVPLLSWRLSDSAKGRKSDDGICGPSGLYRPEVRWIRGQDGALAIHGMVRGFGASDDSQLRHSLAQSKSKASFTGKSLPLRSAEDETPNS